MNYFFEVTTTAPKKALNKAQSKKDPLHGITLEKILTELVEEHGWIYLGDRIDIRCFNFDPSIKSSLNFLRRTPWARKKVENLYLDMLYEKKNDSKL